MDQGTLRLRVHDQNEQLGTLVRGTRVLQLFSDAITEILAADGRRSVKFDSWDAEFPGLIRNGEYLEAKVTRAPIRDGVMQFECAAYKVVALAPDGEELIALREPELIATASVVVQAPLSVVA